MHSPKVIIIGAGVAGLSLAIMLAEQNIDCQVLEARERFDGPTSGVRVSAEGVAILNLIKLTPVGEATKRVDMRFGCLSASFSAREIAPSAIIVTRLALHEKLMKRAQSLGIPVTTGFKVASLTERDGGVEVTSHSRETVTGTLLVGADGVGSTVRQFLNPGQSPTKTYAGYLGVGLITRDDANVEMTLYHYPGQQVGIASCGKAHETATKPSVFLWTHIPMSEAEAGLVTRAGVEAELARRAERWSPELRSKFGQFTKDADAILAYGPVYNGTPPVRWFSDRIILCGDAAHPYGPGGQGISMALKDARALCDVIAHGFTENNKEGFQRTRGQEARIFGEAAEKRNARTAPPTQWGVFIEGIVMKASEIITRGKLML
ncbi:FAD-dependent monooxygenase [Neorhizobium sp. BETTINA12A]|uniref:FAD-dependent oxidoreductase n=1 Tax=Neorhizobium sp. BETTINA12A TaxID=2908924 RepID=UPI001FF47E04|nr:NAD(P)/FAD-dependent oxidoreductase [Neorhizobium sp. BETTINA12A]MCJ9751052.1 FAD-dependent monooxygenase [Neorhizobium sp. BETTINA12A]